MRALCEIIGDGLNCNVMHVTRDKEEQTRKRLGNAYPKMARWTETKNGTERAAQLRGILTP